MHNRPGSSTDMRFQLAPRAPAQVWTQREELSPEVKRNRHTTEARRAVSCFLSQRLPVLLTPSGCSSPPCPTKTRQRPPGVSRMRWDRHQFRTFSFFCKVARSSTAIRHARAGANRRNQDRGLMLKLGTANALMIGKSNACGAEHLHIPGRVEMIRIPMLQPK